MAIARMTKVMIASHRSQAPELLEALQHEGIVQILDAERARVSKEWPELHVEAKRPKDVEDMVGKLEKSIAFLKSRATDKDPTSIFQPLINIENQRYSDIITGSDALALLEETEKVQADIDGLEEG